MSMICAPLIDRGKAIGVLQVLNRRDGGRFDESDKQLLIAFAAQSAIAIRNAQLYQDLREERDRLVALEEDVRKDLARDLHDGPTQIVAAVMMNVEFVRALLKRSPDRVDAELQETSRLAGRAMRQLRTMLFDLRPVVLETRGLISALEVYSGRLTETERFTVHLTVDGQVPRLDKQAESAIFAVVQEAISNARKHTQADNMWIAVQRQRHVLEVSVRDDGCGFDVKETMADYESRGSLGVLNMHERADMVGGSLSMRSVVGAGTTVHMTVPIEPNLLA
jgi:signal transduction histidine kinase